ncbi:hypothetical protein GO491_09605 [Flavobacteriaceae bacterium Ap0902]|nr:hypothetical protein [Flavobacteriaceae bacterium Ap0902]
MYKYITILILFTSILYSCANRSIDYDKKNSTKSVDYELLTYGETGSGIVTDQKVYHNDSSFELAWKQVHARMSPIPAIPTIDFNKERVIFLDFGEHNYGGFVYNIEDISLKENLAIVKVIEHSQDEEMMRMAVMTRPFMFIKINKTNVNQVQVK